MTLLPTRASGRGVSRIADFTLSDYMIHLFQDDHSGNLLDSLINSTVDNMELREYRQVKTLLNLTYGTPVEKIKGFVEGSKFYWKSYV